MDDAEFNKVTFTQFKINKDHVRYRHKPVDYLKLQMALMDEVLGYRKAIDYQEIENK